MVNSVGNVWRVTSHQQLLIICYCSGCKLLFYGQGTDSFQARYTHYCSILRASCVFNWSCTDRELVLSKMYASAFRRGCVPAFWRVCIPAIWRGCTPAFWRSSTSQRCSYIIFIYSIVLSVILTIEQLINIYHT